MTLGIDIAAPPGWRDAGNAPRTTAPVLPVAAPSARRADRLRRLCDPLIARCSLVSTAAVLDVRDFAWTKVLRDDWQAIRDEAADTPSPILYRHGAPVADALAARPHTRAALERIPGLYAASVSTLAPGTHLPARRGATKAIITCDLGLAVPRDGDVRMRVADRVVRWAEGETLLFDDTRSHEIWNDSPGARTVLHLRVARPLRAPGRWLAPLLLPSGQAGRQLSCPGETIPFARPA